MPQSPFPTGPLPVARLAIIAAVVGVAAVAFAYTPGWLSPHRLTPGQGNSWTGASWWPGTRPSSQSRQRPLLHRHIRGERQRFGALQCAGMLSAPSYPVMLFGSVHLPSILPVSDSLHTFLWHAHYYLAFAFFAIILLHAAAILFHKLIRRNGVFETMAPVLTHHQSE
jgi:hypothetical protein